MSATSQWFVFKRTRTACRTAAGKNFAAAAVRSFVNNDSFNPESNDVKVAYSPKMLLCCKWKV